MYIYIHTAVFFCAYYRSTYLNYVTTSTYIHDILCTSTYMNSFFSRKRSRSNENRHDLVPWCSWSSRPKAHDATRCPSSRAANVAWQVLYADMCLESFPCIGLIDFNRDLF